ESIPPDDGPKSFGPQRACQSMIQSIPQLPSLRLSAPRRPRVHLPRRLIRGTARRVVMVCGMFTLVYFAACLFMFFYEPQLVYLPARPEEEWFDKPSAAI